MLPENAAMLKLLKRLGFRPAATRDPSGRAPCATAHLSKLGEQTRPAFISSEAKQRASVAVGGNLASADKASVRAARVEFLPF